jgi:hypothetical protein
MTLRPAEPDDALGVARVHVRSWQMGYRTLLPDDYLDRLRPEDRSRHYAFGSIDPHEPATIVAIEAGAIAGFATTAPACDPDALDCGELWAPDGMRRTQTVWGVTVDEIRYRRSLAG